MGASLRVGLSEAQLRQVIQGFEDAGDAASAARASTALAQTLAAMSPR